MQIRSMIPSDWPGVSDIYRDGIATGNATFQQSIPSWEEWDGAHVQSSRIVAVEGEKICGWAALTPVSGRCVYAGVGEVSVYVAASERGKGIGGELLRQLIVESEQNGFWTLQAGIFPENITSIRMHEQAGFRIVGRREKIGRLDGIWRDTILLEKRSSREF